MIEIRDLTKRLSSAFTLRVPALTIADGERVALIGVNGSGKSTLLRLLAGRLKPDTGGIEIRGRAKCGYQPQSPYAFRGTAAYNITLAGGSPAALPEVLRACELERLADRKMSALSGGERQRVFLARMLYGDYDPLLLDEPLSAADLATGARLTETLLSYCGNGGKTLVFSTHLPRQAESLATRILLMDGGEIIEDGPPALLRAPKTERGAAFLSQWTL